MFKVNNTDKHFSYFIEDITKIIQELKRFSKEDDICSVEQLKNNFNRKINDFYSENRKLNIGVVGQVKAGKSSFLNTLLFNGQEILPKASTPKTATLTKMEYSEHNIIEVEYYAPEEWEVLEENAGVDLDDEIYTSARELISMARHNGIMPSEYLEKGRESIQFDTYEDLISQLNNYVGEDGKVTPLVKAVTLYLNKEEFKGLSIVDTPGLNDPIASRTIRTKEFMEVCDVVFFLSQSGSFLDKSDWTLLSAQLPQKGVKKLVLIASKYDSGLRDVLRDQVEDDIFGSDDNKADNIPDACKIITKKLRKRARQKVEEYEKDLIARECPKELIEVIKSCKKPILVSAMAYNMAGKSVEQYSKEEQNVYNAISKFSENIEADLKTIGNIETVWESFASVIEEKERIIEEKSVSFIPTALEELKQLLTSFQEKAEGRITLLSGKDREQLIEQKQAMEEQINGIKADIITTFGEWNVKLEMEKAEAIKDLRAISKEYNTISDRTGTVTKTGSYSVSTSKWYNPFSWGSSRTEYYTYEEQYSYLSASDAVDNLRKFVLDATNTIEAVFTEAVNMKEMKRKLLNVVVNNFDMGSEKYDSSLFRIMVGDTVNKIEFPMIKIDASQMLNKIAAEFSGEITSASEKINLRNALSNAIGKFFEEMSTQLAESIIDFKGKMAHISEGLQETLLANITQEFDEILEQVENKEKEITNYRDYVKQLEKEIRKL